MKKDYKNAKEKLSEKEDQKEAHTKMPIQLCMTGRFTGEFNFKKFVPIPSVIY